VSIASLQCLILRIIVDAVAVQMNGRGCLLFSRRYWWNQAELAPSAFSRRYLRHRVNENRAELITHIPRALREYNYLRSSLSMVVHEARDARLVLSPNFSDGALGPE